MMVADFFINLVKGFISSLPVISFPSGTSTAITYLASIASFINVFIPLARLAPILALIVLLRNYKIIVAGVRFILYFIPFIG